MIRWTSGPSLDSLAWDYAYDARPTIMTLSVTSATGKERDAESGNDYFEARYYSSAMGRFMSPDWSAKEEPVPYATMGDPQSLNLYSYVRNNPLSRADADGHTPGDYYISNGDKNATYAGSDGVNDGAVHVLEQGSTVTKQDGIIDLASSPDALIRSTDFSKAEGQAIQASVDRTIGPGGNDRQGNMHEEGFTEDASGINNKAPGPAYVPGDSTVHVNGTLTPSTTMDEHTHPGGTAPAAGSFGGGTQFDPKPSTGRGQDVPNAAGQPGVTHVEASAGTGRVYIYNGSGVQANVPLKAFPKPDKQ
jgi:RHS repeat-associated protein